MDFLNEERPGPRADQVFGLTLSGLFTAAAIVIYFWPMITALFGR